MEVMNPKILGVLFVVVIIVMILESIARWTWQSFYFRFGIPLFKKSIRLSSPPNLSVDYLNGQFELGRYVALRFKQIALHEVAFREGFSVFRNFLWSLLGAFKSTKDLGPKKTNIYGSILYDETTRELHVIGFVGWSTPLTSIIFIGIASSVFASFLSSSSDDLPNTGLIFIMFLVILIAILAQSYFAKKKRYAAVFKIFSPEET